jgi:hypothetical protein
MPHHHLGTTAEVIPAKLKHKIESYASAIPIHLGLIYPADMGNAIVQTAPSEFAKTRKGKKVMTAPGEFLSR